MKLLLVSSMVLLGCLSTAMADFNTNYYKAIVEEAQRERENPNLKTVELEPRYGTGFSCQVLSGGTPTSVHALQPQDIEIIGAIGDSLTAANGAKANSIVFLTYEYRGISWSIGCDSTLKDSITFATILRHFNPSLVGCSTGDNSKQNSTAAAYNFAHPGDTSFNMPSQAIMLVNKLKTIPNIDNKWKVINFFIGGNDLCEACKNAKQTPENFKKNIEDTLDYFQTHLPRTLVNLVLTLDVSGVEILTGITCRNMQNSFCDCGLSTPYRPTLKSLLDAYQKDVRALIQSGKYDNSDLFTVVSHDFMTEMTPPLDNSGKADYSYFAPDCFHFSQKGHEAAATELWNSMLTKNHQKAKKWTLGSAIKCPHITDPYIPTNRNHQSLKSLLVK